ncbi:MAG TPA: hypothetical protein VJT31_26605, partial [Rugosimonospora sp.]|nr:hypothetical protein [Rugosimonospora sp.]
MTGTAQTHQATEPETPPESISNSDGSNSEGDGGLPPARLGRDGAEPGRTDLTNLAEGPPAMFGASGEDPVSQATVDGVRAMILAATRRLWQRLPASSRDRALIEAEINEITTIDQLTDDLESLYGKSGSLYIVGDGNAALRIELRVGLTRRDSTQRRPPDQTHGEMRGGGRTLNTAVHDMRTNRDLNVGFRIPVGRPFSALRLVTLNWFLRMTHNQFRRTASVTVGSQFDFIERNRVPSHSAGFELTWVVAVTPVSQQRGAGAPAVADIDVEADTTFVETFTSPLPPNAVWFEEHLATPRADWAEVTDNAEIPRLSVLDALHDPGSVVRKLQQVLVVDGQRVLERLDPQSQRALVRMVNDDNLRGHWPRVRSTGLISEPLVDADGTPVGLVGLRAEVHPRWEVSRSGKIPLETYHRAVAGTSGTASLQNATESSFGAAATIISEPIEQTTTVGTYASGGPGFTVRGSSAVRVTTHSGTEATVSRGQKNSGSDTVLAEADVTWFAWLIAEDELPEVSWTGTVADAEGARLRYVPTSIIPSAQQLWPPAGVIDGDAPGLSDVDEFRFDPVPVGARTEPGVDEAVKARLKQWGVIRAGPLATVAQAANYKRVLDAMSPEHRETNIDVFRTGVAPDEGSPVDRGIGIVLVLDHRTRWGVQQVTVQWMAGNRRVPVQHLGSTEDVRPITDQSTSYQLTRSTRHEWSYGGSTSGEGTVPLGGENPLSGVAPSGTPLPYNVEHSTDATHGATVRHNTLVESETGTVHAFRVPLAVTAAIFRGGDAPDWRYPQPGQPATVRYWVPRFLAQTREPARQLPATIRAVTLHDRAMLRRPGAQRSSLPAVITSVRGSADLDHAFKSLLISVFGRAHRDALVAGAPTVWGFVVQTINAALSVVRLSPVWVLPLVAVLADTLDRLLYALVGVPPSVEGTKSAQIRRSFVSPASLRTNIGQALTSVYGSDQIFESGPLSAFVGTLGLTAYEGKPEYLPPGTGEEEPEFYFEDFVVVTATRRSSLTRGHSRQYDGGVGFNLRPRGGWLPSGQIAGRYVRGTARSTTVRGQEVDVRLYGFEDKLYWLRFPVTFVAAVEGGAHNLLTMLASAVGFDWVYPAELAIDVPGAVQVHATTRELLAIWRTMGRVVDDGERIGGLPASLVTMLTALEAAADADDASRQQGLAPEDPRVRYPRRGLFDLLGMGDAAVAAVRETGPARGLYTKALAAVKRRIAGVTTPASIAYLPGVREWIAALSSTAVLRAATH